MSKLFLSVRFSAAVMLVAVGSATRADECTRQMDGYLAAHRTIIGMDTATPAVKAQAAGELERIEGARESMTDCEVADTIPALSQARAALKAATAATNKQEQPE